MTTTVVTNGFQIAIIAKLNEVHITQSETGRHWIIELDELPKKNASTRHTKQTIVSPTDAESGRVGNKQEG